MKIEIKYTNNTEMIRFKRFGNLIISDDELTRIRRL